MAYVLTPFVSQTRFELRAVISRARPRARGVARELVQVVLERVGGRVPLREGTGCSRDYGLKILPERRHWAPEVGAGFVVGEASEHPAELVDVVAGVEHDVADPHLGWGLEVGDQA